MRNLVINDRARIGAWVAQRVGRVTPWDKDGAIGVEEDGELIGGIVLDDYHPGVSVSMHCAGEGRRWLSRPFLFAIFDYPFNQLEVKVILVKVAENNHDSIRFVTNVGFKEIARIPQAWDGEQAMVLFTMHRADCRWLDLLGGRYAGTETTTTQ